MKLLNKNNKLLFVCHDAGSGNVLLNFIQNKIHNRYNYDLLLSGPSKRICEMYHKNLKFKKPDYKYNKSYDRLITGTSFHSELEHKFRLIYKKNSKIISISLVDNWRNLNQRFYKNLKYSFPNYIWVIDPQTLLYTQNKFPLIKSILIDNDYLKNQLKIIKNIKSKKNSLLYLTEPIKFIHKGKMINEIYIFRYFLENFYKFKLKNHQIILKLHPKENKKKYNRLIKQHSNIKIIIDDQSSIANLIAQNMIVVGFQTSALNIALKAGRKVYSSNPFKNKKIIIEDINLLYLRNL